MKKAAKVILLTVILGAILLAIALPLVVPPAVKSFAEAKLSELGYPSSVSMRLGYTWRNGPELDGSLSVSLDDAPWTVSADFGAGLGTWHAKVVLPQTEFSDCDPLLARLLRDHPLPAVSNLTFAGSIALSASVERTRQTPVPVWTARAPIRIDRIGLMTADTEVSVGSVALTPKASGIATHIDIAPLFLSAKSVCVANVSLTNLYAAARIEEKSILVTEAGAGVCGGTVNLYSLRINPENLNTAFTLFVDDVDAGKALAHVKGFSGEASGRLHGKVRLFVREGGKAVRLSDAFLYSTPGEVGKLKLNEPESVTDNLSMAGVDAATCDNVANALRNLDYAVLRLDLTRLSGKDATLGIRLEGNATRGDLTVPVNLNININGELEQLINIGLGFSQKLKGHTK